MIHGTLAVLGHGQTLDDAVANAGPASRSRAPGDEQVGQTIAVEIAFTQEEIDVLAVVLDGLDAPLTMADHEFDDGERKAFVRACAKIVGLAVAGLAER